MEKDLRYVVPVEMRTAAVDEGPHLLATIIQEGRAGSVRSELFAPMAIIWPPEGIAIRTEHRGKEIIRSIPERHTNGEIRICARATPEIQAAYTTRKFMSIEFVALSENRTSSGIREIERAFVSAAAMVADPEYAQAAAEVREREAQAALQEQDRRWKMEVLL